MMGVWVCVCSIFIFHKSHTVNISPNTVWACRCRVSTIYFHQDQDDSLSTGKEGNFPSWFWLVKSKSDGIHAPLLTAPSTSNKCNQLWKSKRVQWGWTWRLVEIHIWICAFHFFSVLLLIFFFLHEDLSLGVSYRPKINDAVNLFWKDFPWNTNDKRVLHRLLLCI